MTSKKKNNGFMTSLAKTTKDFFVTAPPVASTAASADYKANKKFPQLNFKQDSIKVVQGAYVLRYSDIMDKNESAIANLANDTPMLVTHGNKKILILPDFKSIEDELKNAVDLYAHAKQNKIDYIEGADVLSKSIPHTVTVMAHYFAAQSAGIKEISFNNVERQYSLKIADYIQNNLPIFKELTDGEKVKTYLEGIKNDAYNSVLYVPNIDAQLQQIDILQPGSEEFKKAFAEIARRESIKINSALAAVRNDAKTEHIGIFWFLPDSNKYEFKEPSVPSILIDKLAPNYEIRAYLFTQPDYQVILASFFVYFSLKAIDDYADKIEVALLSSPNTDQTVIAIGILSDYLQLNIVANNIVANNKVQQVIKYLTGLTQKNSGQTVEEGRLLGLLAKTQTADMDVPIKELLREIVTRFEKASLDDEGKSHLKFVKDYLSWLDGGSVGDVPDNKWSLQFQATSILLRDEKKKQNGLNNLAVSLNNLQHLLYTHTTANKESINVINYLKVLKSESSISNDVSDKAILEAQSLIQKREIPDKRPETVVGPGALERMGDAIGSAAENVVGRTASAVGNQLARIPGAPAFRRNIIDPVGRLAVAPVNAASAAVDAVMSQRVGRSAVCDKDEENLSDLQILLRSAIEHADRYLVTQYKMFGMWAVFNLALIGVIVYFLYRIFRAVLSYVQLYREFSKKRETIKSNDIFNPADDNDHYPVDPKLIAKSRIPSGAAIESRLRRLSEETGMDVRGAIDSDGDKYEKKKKTDEDDYDEDDKFYRSRV